MGFGNHSIPMTKEQMEAAIVRKSGGNKSMEMRQALCECLDQMMAGKRKYCCN